MFQYTPYALLLFGAGLVSTLTAIIVWQRRPGTGVVTLFIMTMAIAYWSFNNVLELLVTSFSTKVILTTVLYVGIVTVPTTWLIFILQYTGRNKWVTRRNIILLAIVPAITLLVIATNSFHRLFWTNSALVNLDGMVALENEFGPAFWVHASYSYLLLALGAVLLVQTLVRSPQLYRGQVIWMLIGTVSPWIANGIYIFRISPLPLYIDITPLAFTITGAAYAWSMHRYRLMDIVPVAKNVILDNLIDAIIVLDRNNRIVEANPKALEMLTLSSDEVIGHPAASVLSSFPTLVERYAHVEQARDEISVSLNQQRRTLELNIIPLRDRQGNLTGRVLMMHDITQLKKANEELVIARREAEKANQLKSQFLATMSHELRTPLNAIIGFAELMLSGMGGFTLEERAAHMTERMYANSKKLLALINDVLDLAKIEAQRMELVEKPFSPTELVRSLHGEMESLASQQNLTFKLEVAEDLPAQIVGDAFQVRRIVTNLLSNAFKFTQEGTVTLNARRSEDRKTWRIAVSDTGIGIPPHAIDIVFDPFHQIDSTSQRAYGGTGLGLSITQELVKEMGGTIKVESELGRGSTFVVTLPVKEVTAKTSAVVSAG